MAADNCRARVRSASSIADAVQGITHMDEYEIIHLHIVHQRQGNGLLHFPSNTVAMALSASMETTSQAAQDTQRYPIMASCRVVLTHWYQLSMPSPVVAETCSTLMPGLMRRA